MVFVETKRGQGVDEDPYSCRATIPDDGIAKTTSDVVVENDSGRLEAKGFELNNQTRVLKLDKVRASYRSPR